VRRVCPSCARTTKPRAHERALLSAHGLAAARLESGAGCEACDGTGYRGRTAVVELFAVDERLADTIARGGRGVEVEASLKKRGFRGLAANGLALAAKGVTTVAEVEMTVMG
jgi:type II secretory ATPase GspE/PulE/Tfp pilus assembly ATPase PilB-like protein